MEKNHEYFMRRALAEAKKALRKDEVPIGAVLVKDGKIIARGHNLTRIKRSPLAHAEIEVLLKAIPKMKNERFLETSLYITLEPCSMCAGALVQARIKQLIFGAKEPKTGAVGSVFKIIPSRKLNHRPIVIKGILAAESSQLLQTFFQNKRKKAL